MENWLAFVGTGAAAALVTGLWNYALYRIRRKDEVNDRPIEQIAESQKKTDARVDQLCSQFSIMASDTNIRFDRLEKTEMLSLRERLRSWAKGHLKTEAIEEDELESWNDLYRQYKEYPGANGHLDSLCKKVNRLPVREDIDDTEETDNE